MKNALMLAWLALLMLGGAAWASEIQGVRDNAESDPHANLGNGGGTWQPMGSGTEDSLLGVWGSSSTNVFAVGSSATIRHYDGSTWKYMNPHTTSVSSIEGVWGSSGSVFAVRYDWTSDPQIGGVLQYNGGTWSEMESLEGSPPLYDVWSCSSGHVFVVGDVWVEDGDSGSTIYHYDGNWRLMRFEDDPVASLDGVWGSSDSDVFAVGDNGTILHYNGTTWSRMSSGTNQYLFGVWGSSATDVFAVGDNGTILHYNGTTWSLMFSDPNKYLFGVWGSSDTDVFAVGLDGTILHYNGTTWIPMSSGTDESLEGVWGSSSTDVFAVGSSGTILHYTYDPSTLYVSKYEGCGGNNPCYETIQDAIDAAAINAVIKIARGTYAGSMTLNKSLSLTLQGGWDTDFQSPAGTTLLRQAPKAPKGSLTLQRLTIRP